MHIPDHAVPVKAPGHDLLARLGTADLITMTPHGLLATPLPFEYEPARAGRGSLTGYMARADAQWELPVFGDALAIVRGLDISAHVYGRLVVHDDPEWTGARIRRLTEGWDPPESVVRLRRTVVGVELVISRITTRQTAGLGRREGGLYG